MKCPHGVGRESWERVGRASMGWLALNSPMELGMKPSPRGTLFGRKSDRPECKVIVVVVVVVVVVVLIVFVVYCFIYVFV